MKKYLNISLIYALLAMTGGVFYREFTKFNGFTGVTVLSKVHTHFFLLGMIVFWVVALFSAQHDLKKMKSFRIFMLVYNAGVPLTAVMMAVRGTLQVLEVRLPPGSSAAISGISGIGHILTGIGIILLIFSFKKIAKED